LLLDTALNDGGALALCTTLRRNGFSGAIVMFDAAPDEGKVVSYLEAGADDVLVTTIGLPELVARVRALIRYRPTRHAPASEPVAQAA
jgi:DNA-binding response OmpR family regulator